ncbi:MAG: phosphonoacetaldehyde hydrolase [Cellvibrionaceae bacterium]|nr:phosphonoacetaldehyde hydrolase [Cellvibrionaceae bacterium]
MNIDKQLIEAVVLDWAGTVVDYGSVAPTSIFVEAFKQAYDFELSLDEARIPMGMGKWDHIQALGKIESVDQRWRAQFGEPMSDAIVDQIYATFMPLQKAKVADYSDPIPGALAFINELKAMGIKIGSCSGYPREVMEILVKAAAAKGYSPDHYVASDEIAAGSRPGPWMALQNVIELGIMDVGRVIKFDDSAPGIVEGKNAGMWTIGLSLSGNAVGLTLAEWQAQSPAQQAELKAKAVAELEGAGAHYVVDDLASARAAVEAIGERIRQGERPA